MKKIISKLQRRNVIKASISYAVVGFAILEAADIAFPVLGVPENVFRYLLYLLIAGFPAWIIFAYIYEWTPDGFKKTDNVLEEKSIHKKTDQRLTYVIVFGVLFVTTLFFLDRNLGAITSEENSDAIESRSIAVIPFEQIGSDEDFFATGVTEDIMTQVAGIKNLRVVSRFVMQDYEYRGKTPQEIGEELRVKHILFGNIRRSENKVRVGCQLVDVSTEGEIWATTYDRNIEDVFEIQKEVAEQVAIKLKRTFIESDKSQIGTSNIKAYSYYLKGKSLSKEDDFESTKQSINYFKLAISEDPNYAAAYAGVGNSIIFGIRWFGGINNFEWDSARYYIKKAVEIDPNEIEGWAQLSSLYWMEGAYEEQEKAIKQALQIDPNHVEILFQLGNLYYSRQMPAEAIKYYYKVISLEPLYSSAYTNLSAIYGNYGLFKKYDKFQKIAATINTDGNLVWFNRSSNYIDQENYQLAAVALDSMIAEDSLNARRYENAAYLSSFFDESLMKEYAFKAMKQPNYDTTGLNRIHIAWFLKKEGNLDYARYVANSNLEFVETRIDFKNQYVLKGMASCYILLDEYDQAAETLYEMAKMPEFIRWQDLSKSLIFQVLKDHPRFKDAIALAKGRYDKGRREILQLEAEIEEDELIESFGM